MKRKFLCISCCFLLSVSLMCCSKIKSSLDDDGTNSTTTEALLNDSLSVEESEALDAVASDNPADSADSADKNAETATDSETTSTPVAVDKNATPENLSSVEDSAAKADTYRLFFYNSVDKTRYYVDINLNVESNALVSALTSALQENQYTSNFVALTDKIGVNSATIDPVTNALTVKFNYSFKDYMTLDPATEYELIYTLVNTYAYNYGVNKVSLYFKDIQYTSAPSCDANGWYSPYFDSSVQFSKN